MPFLRRPPPVHVALADASSKGLDYDPSAALRRQLVELVGLSPQQTADALAQAPEKARACWERWLALGGRFYGRDMAPPLAQEEIRAILGEEPTVERLEEDEERGLTIGQRRARKAWALLTPEEQAIRRPEDEDHVAAADAATTGGLYLTDADEPVGLARGGTRTLAVRSNDGVKLTPSHYPALRSDPSGTLDFHLPPFCAPQLFVPAYLQPNYRFCTLTYLRHPTARHNACELPSPFDAKGSAMRRAWEWYKGHKMRVKSYAGGLYPGGTDARARRAYARRGPELGRTGVHEDMY